MNARLLIFAVFLLSISLVQATMNPSQYLCDENGTMSFNLAYSGLKLDLKSTEVSAVRKAYSDTKNISGVWTWKGQKIETVDSEETVFLNFKADKTFTSKGDYLVSISSTYDETSFLVSCPGTVCSKGEDCANNDFCSTDKHCQTLKCGECQIAVNHVCSKKCDDKNLCTEDTCIDGTCKNKYINNCCLTHANCNDGLLCTADLCINYRCSHEKINCSDKECGKYVCREYLGCTLDQMDNICLNQDKKLSSFFESSLAAKIIRKASEIKNHIFGFRI